MSGRSRRKAAEPEQSPTHPHMAESIEAIAAMVEKQEQSIGRHQRGIEKLVSAISQPLFLLISILVMASWVAANLWLQTLGFHSWDYQPFPVLEVVVQIASFLLASMILITQNRQAKVAERHAHLDLQVNLLVDRKVSKVLQLMEEMRRDNPLIRNRVDLEAEALQTTADPVAVAESIATRLDDSAMP